MKQRGRAGTILYAIMGLTLAAAVLLSLVIRPYAESLPGSSGGNSPLRTDAAAVSDSNSGLILSSAGGKAAASESTLSAGSADTAASAAAGPSAVSSAAGQAVLRKVLPDGSTFTVTLPAGAFPGVEPGRLTLQITEKGAQSGVSTLLQNAAKAEKKSLLAYRLFDISILDGSVAVEPSGTVQVELTGVKTSGGYGQEVYHVNAGADAVENMNARANGSNRTITFSTTHFSTFAVLTAASLTVSKTIVTSGSTAPPTAASIASGLGTAGSFSVFANSLYLQAHMDGTVAVNSLGASGGNLGLTSNLYNTISAYNVTVTVNAGVLNAGKSYTIGVFSDAAGKSRVGSTTLKIGSDGTASTVVSLSGKSVYYLYMLDANSNAIVDGGVQGYSGGGAEIPVGNNSYVNSVNGKIGWSIFQNPGSGFPETTVFGSQYMLSSDGSTFTTSGDGSKSLYLGSTSVVTPIGGQSDNKVYIASADHPMVDFTAGFTALKNLSATLSAATDTDTSTMKVIDVAPAGGQSLTNALAAKLNTDLNGLNNTGIPLGSAQYLLINVDCKNSGGLVAVPSCQIGGVAAGSAWNDVATRIIWNFYDSSQSDKCFTGTVSESFGVQGTLLAPSGSIGVHATMNGACYAQNVTNGSLGSIDGSGEIHQLLFRASTFYSRTVTFGVPFCLKVTKCWNKPCNAAAPTSITVTLYRNGSAYATHELGTDNNWTYTFTNLPSDGTYTVQETPIVNYTASYSGYGYSSGSVSSADTAKVVILCTSSSCSSGPTAEIKITNIYTPGYVLPAAGGSGTTLLYAAGAAMLLLAAAILFLYAKRRAAAG